MSRDPRGIGLKPWAAESIGALLTCKESKEQNDKPGKRRKKYRRASTEIILRNLEDEGGGERLSRESLLSFIFKLLELC